MGKEKFWRYLFFEIGKIKKLYAQQFPLGHWTFIGPGDEMKWYGTRNCRPEGKWNSTAAKMVQNFKETKHPVFTSINALSRGILRQNKRQNIHTLQRWIDEFRIVVQDYILCESAQYLWSSFELVLSIRIERRQTTNSFVGSGEKIYQGYWWTVCKQEKCNPWYR